MPHVKGKGHCYSCSVRNQSIFSDLPEASLEECIKDFHTSVLTYNIGETIFDQLDDSSESAYTLRKGLVKVTKSLPDGRTQIVRILEAGELFGFDGFANENYNNTAIALTDCEVCRLPMADLSVLRKANPEIDQSLVARLIKNLRQSEDMLLELGAKKASEKLASFILRLSLSDQNLPYSGDSLRGSAGREWSKLHLSRSEIGSLLGLTIETVSRFFSDWKRKGFIKEEKGSIQILDAEGLKATACSEGACN